MSSHPFACRPRAWRHCARRPIKDNPTIRPNGWSAPTSKGRTRAGVAYSADFLDLARDPEIAAGGAAIGPGRDPVGCQIFCKPARTAWKCRGNLRMATTAPSARWRPARCGSRSTNRRSKTAACASSRARTGPRELLDHARGPHRPRPPPARHPRLVRRRQGRRHRTGTRPNVDARRLSDPRVEREPLARRRAGVAIRYPCPERRSSTVR